MKNIKKYKFSKVYDLQNSSRTSFYKRILLPKATKDTWSSSETTLPEGTSKDDFDKDSVLSRFDHQLKSSGINTSHTLSPDFSWSSSDISQIKNHHQLDKYIVLFPFLNLIFSIIILPMKLSYRMRMLYMKFNNMNSICGSFGITFLVFIPIVVATNPVDFSSRFTLFCSFVYVTTFIHEKSIAEFAFDESANLQIFIWNQIGKKNI